MPMLDVFQDDAFNTVSLTTAINKLPYVPGLIGSLGLFESRGIPTTVAVVEEQHGVLSLVQSSARGTMPNTNDRPNRIARSFVIPHLPQNEGIMADDVQNVRAFGSETVLQTVASLVNDRLTNMRQNFEATHEYQRAGALQGVVLDADGSEIYNYWDEFGLTSTNYTSDLDLTLDTTDTKSAITDVLISIETGLGATPYSGVVGLCGDDFWKALVSHPTVENAYDRWMDGQFLRDQQLYQGFEYAGVMFYRYRGKVGSKAYIPAGSCVYAPTGVPQLYQQINAPGTFIETVNTMGQPMYVKQQRMDFDVGIELHGQSNPLFIMTRPAASYIHTLP